MYNLRSSRILAFDDLLLGDVKNEFAVLKEELSKLSSISKAAYDREEYVFSPTFITRLLTSVCCRCSVTSHPLSRLIPHPHFQLTQATRCIDVRCDAEHGRYVVANDVIARGDVIIAEKPFAAVLLPDQCATHCDRCFGKLTQVVYP